MKVAATVEFGLHFLKTQLKKLRRTAFEGTEKESHIGLEVVSGSGT